MQRSTRLPVACTTIALLAAVAGSAVAQNSSIVFTKTVGVDPNACATGNIMVEPPPDGIVYYCYKMTYTGALTASCHTLVDSVLGDVLNNTPGGRCCTNASATTCDPDLNSDSKCEFGVQPSTCNDASYPVCAAVTFQGVCCNDEEGTDCPIPLEGCDDTAECSNATYCVTNPIVADGKTVTRVITATVPPGGITNHATWSVQAGICCDNSETTCTGYEGADSCATDADCTGMATCRKEGLGLCCDPNDQSSCAEPEEKGACLVGRECETFDDPNDPFSLCVGFDTIAEGDASARIGVVDTPAMSVIGMAILILGLAGVGLFRVNRARMENR